MYIETDGRNTAAKPGRPRRSRLRTATSALVLLSYIFPLLVVLAIPSPSSAAEAKLFADLRAGICSQQRPASEDPSQDTKHNAARANCVLCKHPAAPAPDGLTTRVWQTLAWTRIRPLQPPADLHHSDQTDGYVQPPRGPPVFFA